VDIAGRHARHAKTLRQSFELPIARTIALKERALKLDAQPIRTECFQQPSQTRFIVDPSQRAAAQAHQAARVLQHRLQRDMGL
jgi:hypothetical protein